MVKLSFQIKGSTLIEIVVGLALFVLIVPTIISMGLAGVQGKEKQASEFSALILAEEAMEVVQALHFESWSILTAGAHGLSQSQGFWELTGSPDSIGKYRREIQITDLSSNRKEAWVAVTWSTDQSVSLMTRLTNWKRATVPWRQTLIADFSAGEFSGTAVTSHGDGAVELIDEEASGTFTSVNFDAGFAEPRYQTLNWTQSGEGQVQFQLRMANSQDGLHRAVWLGPDGTRTSYYVTPGTSIATSGGTRWIEAQATLEGENPVLEDFTIQYAP